MNNIGRNYILIGLVWVLCGMVFGVWMGITERLYFANTHAHANLVGFVASVLFGLIHLNFPALAQLRVAKAQFVIYEAGAVLLVLGKGIVDGGGSNTVVKGASIIVIIGTALMLYMFARHSRDKI